MHRLYPNPCLSLEQRECGLGGREGAEIEIPYRLPDTDCINFLISKSQSCLPLHLGTHQLSQKLPSTLDNSNTFGYRFRKYCKLLDMHIAYYLQYIPIVQIQ